MIIVLRQLLFSGGQGRMNSPTSIAVPPINLHEKYLVFET